MDELYGKLIEPPTVAFHFGAPGWDVLAALLLSGLLFVAWRLVRRHARNRYRREALRMLEDMERGCAGGELIYAVNMLLKSISMKRYSRGVTAAVRGGEWIRFLNRSRGKELFDRSDGNLLQEMYYRPGDEYPAIAGFLIKARDWIKKSRYALRTGV